MSLDVRLKITSDVSGAKQGIQALRGDADRLEKSLGAVGKASAAAGAGIAAVGASGASSFAAAAVGVKSLAAVTVAAGVAGTSIKKLGYDGSKSLALIGSSGLVANTSIKKLGRDGDRSLALLRAEVDKTDQSIKRLGAGSAGVDFNLDDMMRGLKSGNVSIREFNGSLKLTPVLAKAAKVSLKGLAAGATASLALFNATAVTSIKYLGVFGAPVGVAGVAMVTGSVMAAHKELSIMTATLGINRQALEAWGAGAKGINVSAEQVGDIFKDVTEKIGDFTATGGGEAKDIFDRLPIKVEELAGLGADQVLLKIAAAAEKVSDISLQEKTFLFESLANDASKLLPLLENNAQKLRDVDAAARAVGAIMSPAQIATLDEAKTKMAGIKLGLQGIRNEVGTLGASFVNAFEGEINAGMAAFRGWLHVVPYDIAAVRGAWDFAFNGMGESLRPAIDSMGWIDQALHNFRVELTYLPVISKAVFTDIGTIISKWYYDANSRGEDFRESVYRTMGGVLEGFQSAYKGIMNIGGSAIAYLINRNADLVSALGSVGNIPGFGDFGDALKGRAEDMRQLANRAAVSGDRMAESMTPAINALKATADEAARSSGQWSEMAFHARKSAGEASRSAKAFIADSEAKRSSAISSGDLAREQFALNSSLDKSGGALTKYRINQEAVNKALKIGVKEGAAAKKAKSDLEKASDKLQQSQASELSTLRNTHNQLTMNAQDYYVAGLNAKNFDSETVKLAKSLNYKNAVLAQEKRLLEQRRGLSSNLRGGYRFELEDEGITGPDADELIDKSMGIALDGEKKQLKDRADLLGLNAQQTYVASLAAKGFEADAQREAGALNYSNTLR